MTQTKDIASYKLKHKTLSIAAIAAGVFILGILSFVFGNVRDLLFGVPLSVTTASDGATLSDGLLPISGRAKHARQLLINGRSILIDRDGNFSDSVLLSPGYNVVEVTLKDQFGKEKTQLYRLVLDEATTPVAARLEPIGRF